MRRFVLVSILIACFAPVSLAQGLGGKGRYPQFRGLSGLPGSGSGVTADGRFSLSGAMTYTTPIGYTPGGYSVAASIGVVSVNSVLRLTDSTSQRSNGTGSILVGVDFLRGRLAGGAMLLSRELDSALTVQYGQVFHEKFGFAIGVQDINGGGGSAGEGQPTDGMSSSSVFGVATAKLAEGIHATAGIGNRRFRNGFGSLSASITPNIKAILEHDGFSLNYGIAFGTSDPQQEDAWERIVRKLNTTVFIGLVNGRQATWSISVSF